jgi:hypothetical protein
MSRQLVATLAILVCGLVPDRLSGDGPSRLRDSLKSHLLNRGDLERIERGYYEQLIDAGRRLDDLADVPGPRTGRRHGGTWLVPVDDAPLVTRVDDLREVVLKPAHAALRRGVHWRTNPQGMRDRAYALDKPPRTFRIALVGDSIAAGSGVDEERRFESILEHVWDTRARSASGVAVEIINCAVPGHSPGQRWSHFRQVGWQMNPDLVICESTAADIGWDERRLRYLLARGFGWDSPVYKRAIERAGVKPNASPDDYKRDLRPRHWDILASVYQTMAADCRAKGVPVIWVLIPRVGRFGDAAAQQTLKKTAQDAGFSQVVDVTDAYNDADPARLAVDADDFHPNALGHRRLARRIDSTLSELPELQPLWAPTHARAQVGDLDSKVEVATAAVQCAATDILVPTKPRAGEPR